MVQRQFLFFNDPVSVHALLDCEPRSPLAQALAVLRIVKGSLAMDYRPLSFSQLCVIMPWNSLVGNDSVVPESNRPGRPFPANSQIICVGQVLAEEGQDVVRLLGVELLDAIDEMGVIEERLESGDWVCVDQRMGCDNGGSVWCASPIDGGEIGLLRALPRQSISVDDIPQSKGLYIRLTSERRASPQWPFGKRDSRRHTGRFGW